jgi:hypothetical protein
LPTQCRAQQGHQSVLTSTIFLFKTVLKCDNSTRIVCADVEVVYMIDAPRRRGGTRSLAAQDFHILVT